MPLHHYQLRIEHRGGPAYRWNRYLRPGAEFAVAAGKTALQAAAQYERAHPGHVVTHTRALGCVVALTIHRGVAP